MKFEVNGSEVFASTGGRPFDKNKPLIIFVYSDKKHSFRKIREIR